MQPPAMTLTESELRAWQTEQHRKHDPSIQQGFYRGYKLWTNRWAGLWGPKRPRRVCWIGDANSFLIMGYMCGWTDDEAVERAKSKIDVWKSRRRPAAPVDGMIWDK